MPHVNTVYMTSEMSLVWRVRHTRHTWGINEVVVRVAAMLPIQSIVFISENFRLILNNPSVNSILNQVWMSVPD